MVPLMENSSGETRFSSSSIFVSATSCFTRALIRSPSARMSSSHSFLPTSDSTMSRLVRMSVNGVFSSWLASVMNCFCFS